MSGQGGGLSRDPFHQAAVAGKGVDIMIDHVEARSVEVGPHPAAPERHAH